MKPPAQAPPIKAFRKKPPLRERRVRREMAGRIRLARERSYLESATASTLQELENAGFGITDAVKSLSAKGIERPVIVDLGCANMVALQELKEKFPFIQAIGTDVTKYPGLPRGNEIHFKRMHFHQLAEKFAPNSIHFMWSHSALAHSVNFQEIFRQARTVLRPGGKFVFNVTARMISDNPSGEINFFEPFAIYGKKALPFISKLQKMGFEVKTKKDTLFRSHETRTYLALIELTKK